MVDNTSRVQLSVIIGAVIGVVWGILYTSNTLSDSFDLYRIVRFGAMFVAVGGFFGAVCGWIVGSCIDIFTHRW